MAKDLKNGNRLTSELGVHHVAALDSHHLLRILLLSLLGSGLVVVLDAQRQHEVNALSTQQAGVG